MNEQEKLKHCVGCRDNYYNQTGNSTTGKCWMLESMKLIFRKEVSINQIPPWTQEAQLFPNCYRKSGYVYLKP